MCADLSAADGQGAGLRQSLRWYADSLQLYSNKKSFENLKTRFFVVVSGVTKVNRGF